MKTLIYGAGPIGRWLALRLHREGMDVTLLARGRTYMTLAEEGIKIVDGLTGRRNSGRVGLASRLDAEDHYDLVVVAMRKSARLSVCPVLARNPHLGHIVFVGNDVSGFHEYRRYLAAESVMLGFPGIGGGRDRRTGDLVILDRRKPRAPAGPLFLGELDGPTRDRTRRIAAFFESAGIDARVEEDMDGWLKYHFAFIAPLAGTVFGKGGDIRAVGRDGAAVRRFCRACRQAGEVLQAAGYHRRQPPVFNLFYWIPRWLEPTVFGRLFGSRAAEIRFGLHARAAAPELLEMAEEFEVLKTRAGVPTPDLDALLGHLPRPHAVGEAREAAS
ncbi:MAG: 2-dehydropantoate 2-reductase N-terminal domain-containing protein [Gemmatimonadota bacterium]|jgi:2-dehydropantoate 2-reductase